MRMENCLAISETVEGPWRNQTKIWRWAVERMVRCFITSHLGIPGVVSATAFANKNTLKLILVIHFQWNCEK